MNEDALVKESVPRQAHCATDSFAALETVYSFSTLIDSIN